MTLKGWWAKSTTAPKDAQFHSYMSKVADDRDVAGETGMAMQAVAVTQRCCLIQWAAQAMVVEVRHVLGQHHRERRLMISIRSSNSRRTVVIHRSGHFQEVDPTGRVLQIVTRFVTHQYTR